MAQVLITPTLYRRLKAEAGRRGIAVDEVAVELLEKALNVPLDRQSAPPSTSNSPRSSYKKPRGF